MTSPYRDEWGRHLGYCNACGTEEELGQDCAECDEGEVVQYDDDPEEED